MGTEKQINWFSRILIISIFILVIGLIVVNFFIFSDPKGSFTSFTITLIAFLIVISLSENFDKLSVGSIIELNRKRTELKEEKEENEKLRSQLISVTNSINQSQANMNFIGNSNDKIMDRLISYVIKANSDEMKEKEKEEEIEDNDITEGDASSQTELGFQQKNIRQKIDFRKIEEYAIDEYLKTLKLPKSKIITDIKLAYKIRNIDPISNYDYIFDGFIEENEQFVEVKLNRNNSIMYRDRLYGMLSKIQYYKLAKKVNASLHLILVNIPSAENNKYPRNSRTSIENLFEPARDSGLLTIDYLDINEEDMKTFFREYAT